MKNKNACLVFNVSGTPFNILLSSNRSFFSEINHIISKIYNLLSTEREIVPIQNLAHFLMLPPELSGDEIISMRGGQYTNGHFSISYTNKYIYSKLSFLNPI